MSNGVERIKKNLEELKVHLEKQKEKQEKTDKAHEKLLRMLDQMILQQEIIREMQFKQSSNP